MTRFCIVCVRRFVAVPTQAFNLAFKDSIKAMFPKVDKKQDALKSFAINMASGGLAGAGSLMIVYPLDDARTRLASDVGTGKAQFKGLADCLVKTASGPGGVLSLYNGFGVSVIGIIPYRGVYFGFFDTLMVSHPGSRSQAEARPRLTLHLSPPRHPLWLTLCPCSCRGDIVCRTGMCTLAPRMSSSAQRPPSRAPRPRPSPLATPRTPSTPCVVACRCSPRSPRYGLQGVQPK